MAEQEFSPCGGPSGPGPDEAQQSPHAGGRKVFRLRAGAVVAMLAAGMLLGSCAGNPPAPGLQSSPKQTEQPTNTSVTEPAAWAQGTAEAGPIIGSGQDDTGDTETRETSLYPGTGKFLGTSVKPAEERRGAGEITLNFENTDIREVVKVIMGDLLGLNYILDPRVKGAASLQTSRPLTNEELLPTLETLLRMNGAALVIVDGTYRVLPQGVALRGTISPQLGESPKPFPQGYRLLVVPLRYVSVNEMSAILEPLAPEGSVIRVDPLRNILLLAGSGSELDPLLETIDLFDVHWLEGLSVGFFPVKYVKVDDVLKDLDQVFGDREQGPFAGMLRLVPIASGNGLLAVTQNPEYLEEVRKWVERLDEIGATEGEDERLFVYRVRNGKAADVATLLTDLFSGKNEDKERRSSSELAPGRQPVTLTSSSASEDKGGEKKPKPASSSTTRAREATGKPTSIKVVADETNNSLLILATPRDYEKILAALEKLDIVPLQVLIEATIIEVVLNDEFKFGLEWFFQVDHGAGRKSELSLTNEGPTAIAPLVPGFNWSLINSSAEIRANLAATVGDSRVNVLSSPSVMVLDNQTAKIQVGDSVPVATQSQASSEGVSITNSIEYRDTGVMLSVTPRVNPGGLVVMEIEQDVSNAVDTTSSNLDSPTIQTRNITSSVAVQHGQAVVLGGLIKEEHEEGQSGVPGLYKIPVIGWAFGQQDRSNTRTELVVVLEPSVIGSTKDAKAVVNDFRNRLKGIDWKLLSSVVGRNIPPPTATDGGAGVGTDAASESNGAGEKKGAVGP